MTLTEKLAALPPYLRTTAELSQATGYTSLGMLREWQNKAVLARNALLCEALRIVILDAEVAECHYDIVDGFVLNDCRAILAACEVKQP
jgi:hypothetical protein